MSTIDLAPGAFLSLYLEDGGAAGQRACLAVRAGRDYLHLLELATLEQHKVRLRELAEQQRRGLAFAFKPSRGVRRRLRQRIRDWKRFGFRYPRAFVKEALRTLEEVKS